jgi:hypothetical protein
MWNSTTKLRRNAKAGQQTSDPIMPAEDAATGTLSEQSMHSQHAPESSVTLGVPDVVQRLSQHMVGGF